MNMVPHGRKISVIGLGYVGLPVAVAFGLKGSPVIAFDISESRIQELKAGMDSTGEVEPESLAKAALLFTTNPADLSDADFHIVTVPTPINDAKRPDFTPLAMASQMIGKVVKKGDIVVFESTVYPGATENICAPILEAESGLRFGVDFTLGYSPERINPGDKVHRFETIKKVVSGSDPETADIVADVYDSVIEAGVHKAPSIVVAEAAKVIENTQRDLNIALMNELALIFHRLRIDTRDVLEAAGTKWNFLPFTPGLVGGHCIGVDPYYLTHRAEQVGLHPQVILAGRKINDGMGAFVAQEVVKTLMKCPVTARYKVTVLGVTFKENVPDFRNSKTVDLIEELESFGVDVQVHDPLADSKLVKAEYGITLSDRRDLLPADAVVLTVAHDCFKEDSWALLQSMLYLGKGWVFDVKGCLSRENRPHDVQLWRL